MHAATRICTCRHRADEHLDFAGPCVGNTPCDCGIFIEASESMQKRLTVQRSEEPPIHAGSEGMTGGANYPEKYR